MMVMRDSDSFRNNEWNSGAFLGRPCGVPRDALLELSLLGRLSITNFVVILCVVVAHLLIPRVVSAVEGFASLSMDGVKFRLPLPSTNDGVDVERIKFQPVASAP